jgi:excisionase family DNA binding protein
VKVKRTYTVDEAGSLLNISPRIIRKYIDADRLPARKTPGSLNHVIKRSDLVHWAEGQGLDTTPISHMFADAFASSWWFALLYYLLVIALVICIWTTK